MKKMFIRIGAILFWLGIVALFLYGPIIIDRLTAKRSINILAWPNMFDAQYLTEFEKNTGIKVHVTYFEDNEELLVKLRSTSGKGYDLIMPSDYVVQQLIQANLIKKIDKTKLLFWPDIYPELQNHYFDPGNQYTIPYAWGMYGLGINTQLVSLDEHELGSWSLLFDQRVSPGYVGMLDDAREVVHIASQYLLGHKESLSLQELQQIKELLLKQKSWVAMYTDMRSDYLLITETSPVVVGISNDLSGILEDYPHIKFVVPREGSFVVIDNLAIVQQSNKEQEIYAFLNYLYQPRILKKYVKNFDLLSPLKSVNSNIPCFEFCSPTSELFKQLHFFNIPIEESILNDIWISLKS